jgi:archaellum component FlaC
MAKSDHALYEIKEEVRELRTLYKELIDRLIPVEKATPTEKKAIAHRDDIASERELMEVLGVHDSD